MGSKSNDCVATMQPSHIGSRFTLAPISLWRPSCLILWRPLCVKFTMSMKILRAVLNFTFCITLKNLYFPAGKLCTLLESLPFSKLLFS
uniref:Uncharacterized protein n=1 Tax=Romanomermis culicivorax TaxID=13658 RepID=A0A915JEF9_ROMCU